MRKQKKPYYNEVKPLHRLTDYLDNMRALGTHPAFRYKQNNDEFEVSYEGFADDICALGRGLKSLGVEKTHIACVGQNSYQWLLSYLCVLCSDSVFVPVDRDLPADDMLYVLNQSDATVLICGEGYEEKIKGLHDRLPNIKLIISMDRTEDKDGFLSFDGLIEKGRAQTDIAYPDYTDQDNELKMLVYTSGTTGLAKGVMLSEHNLVSCVYYGLEISTVYDTCLSVLPYHHTYEAVCGILVSLHKGATICINESLRAVSRNLLQYKPSYIMLVPAFVETFYKKIMDGIKKQGQEKKLQTGIKLSRTMLKMGIDIRPEIFKEIHAVFGGRMKKLVCGGAPIRPEVAQFFEDIGISLCNGYGITECSPLISANQDYFNDPKSVGVWLRCLEVKIVDELEDGCGEICVKGDTVMLGYYHNEEETQKAMEGEWFHTGDYGKIDENGRLFITGRKKNLIVLSNGKNIYPEEIENDIMEIPYVAEVVVYSRIEDGREKSLCAEVFLSEESIEALGIKNPQEQIKTDIAARLSALPAYKQVTEVIVRDTEFEKTTSRKIKRAKYNQA